MCDLNLLINKDTAEIKQRHVVRLKTSYYSDSKGLHSRKSLITLKRKSINYRILEEDSNMIGVDDVITRIINFYDVDDGIYEVITCNESRDYESGVIDDYNYKLVPFTEPNK